MSELSEAVFHRKFSRNLYKEKRMNLCSMTFSNRLLNPRGDLYPVTSQSGEYSEDFSNGNYIFSSKGLSHISRLMGGLFPYSTYEVKMYEIPSCGRCGFAFDHVRDSVIVCLVFKNGKADIEFTRNGRVEIVLQNTDFSCSDSLMVTLHHGKYFDIYKKSGEYISFLCKITCDELAYTTDRKTAQNSTASLYLETDGASMQVGNVSSFIDCGVGQADIKPIKYEDGTPIIENGRVYLTYTSRYETEMVQQVMSWKYDTCEFNLEGIILFDCGDGKLCGDVASSLIYDRNSRLWRIWMCCFSHGHVLGYSEFKGDVRFGISTVKVCPMETKKDTQRTEFFGFDGDEDPDFYYDENEKMWYLAVCRLNPKSGSYCYYLFSSDSPSKNFSFVSQSVGTETTGGSFVLYHGKRYFVCGARFGEKSRYEVYACHDFSKSSTLKFDYPDGGFRGWGSIFPVSNAGGEKYKHITFDRINASDYNWSYGNIYVFEAE